MTIAAMRDYGSMREIINITPQDIKKLYMRMMSSRSSQIAGLPKANNQQSGEEKLASSMDKLDVMQERYRLAIEYMGWFEPAWSTLTDGEQKILKE